MLKKVLGSILLCSVLLSTAAFAATKSDWYGTYDLGHGIWVKHTPNSVTLNGFITAGKGIDMNHTSINGMTIENLHLKTDSTRVEFEAAVKRISVF